MARNWRCSYCDHATTITKEGETTSQAVLNGRSKHGLLGLTVHSVSCPNPECRQLQVTVGFQQFKAIGENKVSWLNVIESKTLWPEGKVLPLPGSIPAAIRKTYKEAEASGAASAALSRRCLQGIVRDFFKIPNNKRGDLGAELSFVKAKIDVQIWEDIQAVRGVGDIGAHMDKNVDVIVDVEPKEAELLIGLIETLFRVWYIERDRRSAQSEALRELLGDKRKQQKVAKEALNKPATGSETPDAD